MRKNAADRNNGRKTDGTFANGNPGRPKGARHKTTLAVEALMEGEAEEITRKAIEAAKSGDMTAIRLVLDRVAPPRKSSPVRLDLPESKTVADVSTALATVLTAVAEGELSPDEGTAISGLLELRRKSIETTELEQRIAEIERSLKK